MSDQERRGSRCCYGDAVVRSRYGSIRYGADDDAVHEAGRCKGHDLLQRWTDRGAGDHVPNFRDDAADGVVLEVPAEGNEDEFILIVACHERFAQCALPVEQVERDARREDTGHALHEVREPELLAAALADVERVQREDRGLPDHRERRVLVEHELADSRRVSRVDPGEFRQAETQDERDGLVDVVHRVEASLLRDGGGAL